MIGAIIGGAVSAIGGLMAQHKAQEQLKEQRRLLNEQKNASNQLYTERAYADPTQRASARYLLSRAEQAYRDRNRASEGKRAVVGGSEDSVAADKQANEEGLASATAQVAAQADARADSAAQQHSAEQQSIMQQQGALAQQSAEQTAKAANAFTQTVGSVVDAIDGGGKSIFGDASLAANTISLPSSNA